MGQQDLDHKFWLAGTHYKDDKTTELNIPHSTLPSTAFLAPEKEWWGFKLQWHSWGGAQHCKSRHMTTLLGFIALKDYITHKTWMGNGYVFYLFIQGKKIYGSLHLGIDQWYKLYHGTKCRITGFCLRLLSGCNFTVSPWLTGRRYWLRVWSCTLWSCHFYCRKYLLFYGAAKADVIFNIHWTVNHPAFHNWVGPTMLIFSCWPGGMNKVGLWERSS